MIYLIFFRTYAFNMLMWRSRMYLLSALLAAAVVMPAFPADEFVTSMRKGVELRRDGHSKRALERFESALRSAMSRNDSRGKRQAQAEIGVTYMQQGKLKDALRELKTSFEGASRQDPEQAIIANDLANLYARQEEWNAALNCYALALDAPDPEVAISVALNRARLLPPTQRADAVSETLERIARLPGRKQLRFYLNARAVVSAPSRIWFASDTDAEGVCPASGDGTRVLEELERSGEGWPEKSASDLALAQASLCSAAAQLSISCSHPGPTASDFTQSRRDYPAHLLAEFYLAMAERLGEGTAQAEVVAFCDAALRLLAEEQRRDLLYVKAQGLRAKSLLEKGSNEEALRAYGRAVHAIAMLRRDLPVVTDRSHAVAFKTFDNVHEGLTDLLLVKARGATGKEKQRLLEEVLDLQEKRQQTEVQQYLGDQCVVDLDTVKLDELPPGAVVLYPIVLTHRIELLAQRGGEKIEHLPKQDVKKEDLETLVKRVRGSLVREEDADDDLKTLYNLLLRPLTSRIDSRAIETLVIVPDGVLRLVPFAALVDEKETNSNKRYAIQKFPIGIVPGRSVLGKQPLAASEARVLVAGIWNFGAIDKKATDELTIRAQRQRMFIDELGELPGIESEVQTLKALLGESRVKVLANEAFNADEFLHEIRTGKYRVVHVASHGWFGDRDEDNFIVAHDGLLNRRTWRELRQEKGDVAEALRNNPIELLTLSACQTAQGSDRSPLGLVGAALQARARSVLGSLWPVRDDAARTLMERFYERFLKQDQGMSKVEALRQAQVDMIEAKWRPGAWASFTLVGNWL
jgi:CHAT domain-containing protein